MSAPLSPETLERARREAARLFERERKEAQRARRAAQIARQGAWTWGACEEPQTGSGTASSTPAHTQPRSSRQSGQAGVRAAAIARINRPVTAWTQLDLLAWVRGPARTDHRHPTRPSTRLPLVQPVQPIEARDQSEAQPAVSPCIPCDKRRVCRSPCALLTAMLDPEVIEVTQEVSSPALMAGRGYSESFMVQPEANALWTDDDDDVEHWPAIVEAFGPKLLEAVDQPGLLSRAQREVMRELLAGKSRRQIWMARGTSRQATHKVLHAALRTLIEVLGPLPEGMRR